MQKQTPILHNSCECNFLYKTSFQKKFEIGF